MSDGLRRPARGTRPPHHLPRPRLHRLWADCPLLAPTTRRRRGGEIDHALPLTRRRLLPRRRRRAVRLALAAVNDAAFLKDTSGLESPPLAAPPPLLFELRRTCSALLERIRERSRPCPCRTPARSARWPPRTTPTATAKGRAALRGASPPPPLLPALQQLVYCLHRLLERADVGDPTVRRSWTSLTCSGEGGCRVVAARGGAPQRVYHNVDGGSRATRPPRSSPAAAGLTRTPAHAAASARAAAAAGAAAAAEDQPRMAAPLSAPPRMHRGWRRRSLRCVREVGRAGRRAVRRAASRRSSAPHL